MKKKSVRQLDLGNGVIIMFYDSINILYSPLSYEQAYSKVECYNILYMIKHRVQLNLGNDASVAKFISDCSGFIKEFKIKQYIK